LLASLFLCVSCLHSRTGAYSAPKKITLRISAGSVILKIDGRINENLYYGSIIDTREKNNEYYDRLAVKEGTITINEEKYLSTGEEYSFSLQPTEVVTINIRSLNNNDAEVIAYEEGKEKIYEIKGTGFLGKTLGFQNR
jgi:hypothetical protein